MSIAFRRHAHTHTRCEIQIVNISNRHSSALQKALRVLDVAFKGALAVVSNHANSAYLESQRQARADGAPHADDFMRPINTMEFLDVLSATRLTVIDNTVAAMQKAFSLVTKPVRPLGLAGPGSDTKTSGDSKASGDSVSSDPFSRIFEPYFELHNQVRLSCPGFIERGRASNLGRTRAVVLSGPFATHF